MLAVVKGDLYSKIIMSLSKQGTPNVYRMVSRNWWGGGGGGCVGVDAVFHMMADNCVLSCIVIIRRGHTMHE
jgi:hypothetical protein